MRIGPMTQYDPDCTNPMIAKYQGPQYALNCIEEIREKYLRFEVQSMVFCDHSHLMFFDRKLSEVNMAINGLPPEEAFWGYPPYIYIDLSTEQYMLRVGDEYKIRLIVNPEIYALMKIEGQSVLYFYRYPRSRCDFYVEGIGYLRK